MIAEIAPWQVWWADFDPQIGREQPGLRTAVIVGTAFACQLPNELALVVPCTTTDRGLPFHPPLGVLRTPTFAMCDQLKSISRERLVRRHPAVLAAQEIEVIRFVLRQLVDTH